ncbi:Glu-tRNA(Gln) amidotransferase subunit GatE [Candidatus Woesearchaeota archaeon]|nr:Glu-tRNA(Gln) amidotransferase subunit GatE [Candidatus Woesearchaeota archaeon]
MTDRLKHYYEGLGFKCGLELHQQIAGHKLFCDCPSWVRGNKKDIEVERQLRAAAGELGGIDIAAEFEMAKQKKHIYTGDSDCVCEVELDDDPPKPLNKDALHVALQVALMLNAKIVDEIQVMRKTVVDGSNVGGFQRTALIATDGHIETSKGKVRISVICLEEEAAQKLEETKDTITWNLDRLGVPLIEVGTEADIKDPDHAKEVAEKIGMIMKSTGKTVRGIGSVRQDVNVSIKGHPRVEIKGFQDLRTIPKVIEQEVERQLDEIKKKKKLESHVRKALPDGTTEYMRPMPGAERMYPETDIAPIVPNLSSVKKVELIEEKAERIEKLGVGKDLAKLISKEHLADLFFEFVDKYKNVKPAFIAETMLPTLKELKRKHNVDIEKIKKEHLEKVFEALNKGKIGKDSIVDILKKVPDIKKLEDLGKIIEQFILISDEELEKEIKKIVDENKSTPFGALMGMAMKKFAGKAEGKKISEILKKLLNQ